jgi:membrane fusion protein, multidrug efflux system
MASGSRKRRYALVVAGLLLVICALGGLKYCQISSLMAKGDQMAAAGPPPEVVGSARVGTGSWESTLFAVGSLTGADTVAVSNDAPGIVDRIRFESGEMVKRGQVLVELDARAERAQRTTAASRRDLARITADRARGLFHQYGAIPREEMERQQTALETAISEVAEVEALIERKIIRAPFDGRLGIRAINVGQYLNPGTTITTLDAVGHLFVDFALPQQALADVRVAQPVRVELPGAGEVVTGRLDAIDPTIDDATRNLRLRATIPDPGGRLRPGMFVRVSVVLPARADVIVVPQTAVVHASYGDSVFIIEPKPPGSPGMSRAPDGKPVRIARQQFVRLGRTRGDFVAIAEGVKAGQEVVDAGAFKLRNGVPVVVDNRVKPQPHEKPHPENR